MKFRHQIVLKNSKLDIGLGPGVVFEQPREISDRTLKLMETSASVQYIKTECDMMYLLDHVEIRMVKE